MERTQYLTRNIVYPDQRMSNSQQVFYFVSAVLMVSIPQSSTQFLIIQVKPIQTELV